MAPTHSRFAVFSALAAIVRGDNLATPRHQNPWDNSFFQTSSIPGIIVPKTVRGFTSCKDLVIHCDTCTHASIPGQDAVVVNPAEAGSAAAPALLLYDWLEGHAVANGDHEASNCYIGCQYKPTTMQYPPAGLPDSCKTEACKVTALASAVKSDGCAVLGCEHDEDANACAVNDPHLHFAHGGYADFRGRHGAIFNLLSHTNLSVAARFRDAKYLDLNATRQVDGTYMTEAFISAATVTGKNVRISLEAGVSMPTHAKVVVLSHGRTIREETLDVATKAGLPVREANLEVVVIAAPTPKPQPAADAGSDPLAEVKEGMTLIVTQQHRWRVSVYTYSYLDVTDAKGKPPREMWRIDTSMRLLSGTIEKEAVAPHGLIGQSFDGDELAVDGKKDDYSKAEVVTTAQAEGAIEGVWSDYIVSAPFATSFKFSRYSAKTARPRDVAKLTGAKKLHLRREHAISSVFA